MGNALQPRLCDSLQRTIISRPKQTKQQKLTKCWPLHNSISPKIPVNPFAAHAALFLPCAPRAPFPRAAAESLYIPLQYRAILRACLLLSDRARAATLCVPNFKLRTYGACSFSVFAPQLWNALPQEIRCILPLWAFLNPNLKLIILELLLNEFLSIFLLCDAFSCLVFYVKHF